MKMGIIKKLQERNIQWVTKSVYKIELGNKNKERNLKTFDR